MQGCPRKSELSMSHRRADGVGNPLGCLSEAGALQTGEPQDFGGSA